MSTVNTVKYKRPSGTTIEVADKPANHKAAEALGWEKVGDKAK